MNPSIALTGASGFVGTHLADSLAARGVTFTALHRGNGLPPAGALRTLRHDLADAMFVPDASFPRTLVHLAWQGLPHYRAAHHLEQVDAHVRFVRACVTVGVEHVVVIGTCLEYGMQDGACREDDDVRPVTAYAEAKHRLHRALLALQDDLPFRLSWVRPFYLYGPGQAATSLYTQLRSAIASGQRDFPMSPGDQQRDFIAIEEASRQLAQLCTSLRANGTYNLCSGRPQSVRARIESWLQEWGDPPLRLEPGRLAYPDYEPFAYWGDRSRLDECLASACEAGIFAA